MTLIWPGIPAAMMNKYSVAQAMYAAIGLRMLIRCLKVMSWCGMSIRNFQRFWSSSGWMIRLDSVSDMNETTSMLSLIRVSIREAEAVKRHTTKSQGFEIYFSLCELKKKTITASNLIATSNDSRLCVLFLLCSPIWNVSLTLYNCVVVV